MFMVLFKLDTTLLIILLLHRPFCTCLKNTFMLDIRLVTVTWITRYNVRV